MTDFLCFSRNFSLAASSLKGDGEKKELKKPSSVPSRLTTGATSRLTGLPIKRTSADPAKKTASGFGKEIFLLFLIFILAENEEQVAAEVDEETENEIARMKEEIQRLQDANALLEEQCASTLENKSDEDALMESQLNEANGLEILIGYSAHPIFPIFQTELKGQRENSRRFQKCMQQCNSKRRKIM